MLPSSNSGKSIKALLFKWKFLKVALLAMPFSTFFYEKGSLKLYKNMIIVNGALNITNLDFRKACIPLPILTKICRKRIHYRYNFYQLIISCLHFHILTKIYWKRMHSCPQYPQNHLCLFDNFSWWPVAINSNNQCFLLACDCKPEGVQSDPEPDLTCDANTGICHCKCDVQGDKCDECTDHHYGFPECVG